MPDSSAVSIANKMENFDRENNCWKFINHDFPRQNFVLHCIKDHVAMCGVAICFMYECVYSYIMLHTHIASYGTYVATYSYILCYGLSINIIIFPVTLH